MLFSKKAVSCASFLLPPSTKGMMTETRRVARSGTDIRSKRHLGVEWAWRKRVCSAVIEEQPIEVDRFPTPSGSAGVLSGKTINKTGE